MKSFNLYLFLCFLFCTTFLIAQNYEVYVSSGSGSNSSVKRYSSSGTYLGDFVSPGSGGLNWPQDIIFLESQNILLVSSLNSNAIHQYNAQTGADEGIWATVAGGPTRMTIRPDNLLYVLQWGTNSKVLRFQLDGTPLGEWTDTGVSQSIGAAWNNANTMFVSSYGLGTVRQFDSNGMDQGNFITTLQGPTNLWFHPDASGDILINLWNANKIVRYDSSGNLVGDYVSSIAQPEGYAYLPNGNLLVGSGGAADKISQFQSDGTPLADFATGNGLANPNAIYIRPGVLGVSEYDVNSVFVTPTIGNSFVFQENVVSDYDALNIYTSTGILVETLDPKNTAIWDASKYAEGLYFITATAGDKKATQKIIVKNN
jgi:hypothetical protein